MEPRGRVREQARSYEWFAFAASLPADSVPIKAPGGSQLIESGRGILTGIAASNSATVAGSFQVLDGQDSSGQIILPGQIAASGVAFAALPGQGILLESGCYLVVSAAVLTGALYIIHLWRYPGLTPPGE